MCPNADSTGLGELRFFRTGDGLRLVALRALPALAALFLAFELGVDFFELGDEIEIAARAAAEEAEDESTEATGWANGISPLPTSASSVAQPCRGASSLSLASFASAAGFFLLFETEELEESVVQRLGNMLRELRCQLGLERDLSFSLSPCLSVCVCVYLSIYLSIYLPPPPPLPPNSQLPPLLPRSPVAHAAADFDAPTRARCPVSPAFPHWIDFFLFDEIAYVLGGREPLFDERDEDDKLLAGAEAFFFFVVVVFFFFFSFLPVLVGATSFADEVMAGAVAGRPAPPPPPPPPPFPMP